MTFTEENVKTIPTEKLFDIYESLARRTGRPNEPLETWEEMGNVRMEIMSRMAK